MILVTLPKPTFTNWTLSGSLKPLLILGAAGTSSVALVSSISKSDQSKESLKNALSTLAKPFEPFANKLAQGSLKMFKGLEDWAQYARPILNAISESFTSGSVSTGSRAIIYKLKEWLESIYDMIKTYGPILFSEQLWSQLRSLSQIIKNLLNADMKGNTPLIFALFKAAGKKEFGDFMKEMGNFADKQKETFEKFGAEDMKELFNAFNGDPKGTKEILEKFAKQQDNNPQLKEQMMAAIRPAALKGRIEAAIANAKTYLNRGPLKNADDRKRAEEARKEIQDLKEELGKLIAEAKRNQAKK